jgi:hypothetical protein
MSPHINRPERSKADLETENAVLLSELQLSNLRVKSHEAKISKLKKTLLSKDEFIDWILKQLHIYPRIDNSTCN